MTFVPGETCRRRDLHDQYGGQRQGGISTPRGHPLIFLFTGETGEQYGYTDGFRNDGTFWYTGEGQVGDMEMLRGNLAIRDHQANGKELHLFETVRTGEIEYRGEATCLGHHRETAPDKNGNPRRAIVFELDLEGGSPTGVPAKPASKPPAKGEGKLWRMSLSALRSRALQEAPKGSTRKQQKSNVYERSEAIRVYVLRRAQGICEGCSSPAPFKTPQNRPYLEPHHIRRIADRGPDHPRWVIALCPNCHRRVHYGKGGPDFNAKLARKLSTVESEDD